MRFVLRWFLYLVLMAVVAAVGLSVSSFMGSDSAGAPDMAEAAPEDERPMPSVGKSGGGGRREARARARALDAVDGVFSDLPDASIAFNTPDTIEVGKSAVVQLLLSLEQSIDELKAAVTAAGRKAGARVQVSNKMEARLIGRGFEVTPVTPEVQAVSGGKPTEWKWEVEPTESGTHRLHLTLSAHVTVAGERLPHVVKTFERTMEVNVAWRAVAESFAAENWKWLLTTLIVPVGGEILRRLRRKDDD